MTFFTIILDEKDEELVAEIILMLSKTGKMNKCKCWCLDTPIELINPIFKYVQQKLIQEGNMNQQVELDLRGYDYETNENHK